jgi:hypothetical protein
MRNLLGSLYTMFPHKKKKKKKNKKKEKRKKKKDRYIARIRGLQLVLVYHVWLVSKQEYNIV